MKIINQVKLELENFDKCHLQCDSDCPIGVLYDYSCALQAFILDKIQKSHQPPEEKKQDIQSE